MIKSENIIRVLIISGLILSVPLIAMQFTSEVNWDLFDFIVMSVLLFITGIAFEFIFYKFTNKKYKIVAIIIVVILFLLTWAELAVGIFGTTWAGS